jgi:ferredoxin-NADP reductase
VVSVISSEPVAATEAIAGRPDPLLDLLIARREEHVPGIVVLDLVDPDGRELPCFEAGAHVDVQVSPGVVRQYSLCGNPAHRYIYRLGVLRDPASRGGSSAIHARFHVGSRVRISPPRNLFPLVADARHSVLIGGGIGITPIIAMAHHLHGASRDFTLHYCARVRDKAAFLRELDAAGFCDRLSMHFDDGPASQCFDAARDLPPPAPDIHLYVCGPGGFMASVIAAATRLGYREQQIHREYFKAETDASGEAFEVLLARSNRRIKVPGASTIVAALSSAGVKVATSCAEGICGTCLCSVLSGTPDHRDVYLTDEEKAANDQMLLCCSRSKTPQLVLDL